MILKYLNNKSKTLLLALSIVIVILLGLINYLIGPWISLSLFYLFPIFIVTWAAGKRAGIMMAVFGAAVWFMAENTWRELNALKSLIPYYNAFVRLFLFLLFVFLISALKKLTEGLEKTVEEKTASLLKEIEERKRAEEEREIVIAELKEAIGKIKTLRGIIPICSSCKKIRNDEGYWKQLESYIRDNSEAEFTHGICPDCKKELYPELFREK
jgi:hypothetical protein